MRVPRSLPVIKLYDADHKISNMDGECAAKFMKCDINIIWSTDVEQQFDIYQLPNELSLLTSVSKCCL